MNRLALIFREFSQKVSRRHLIFSTILVLVASIVPIYLIVYSIDEIVSIPYHGPNPITELIPVNDDISENPATELPTSPPEQRVMIGEEAIPKQADRGMGIAAGGELVRYTQPDLNSYFDELSRLGVQWVRWDISWGDIQPNNSNEYDWAGSDRVAETAKRYNIRSLAIITYTPDWAAEYGCNRNYQCAPSDPQAFGKFSGEVASRYKDTISYWEIWNEPNFVNFWSPKPNAKKYGETLKAAYAAIKVANPQAVVLSGGLASTGDEKDGSISPLSFTKTLYETGANHYFDALAVHPYTYPATPKYRAWWNRWQQILPIGKVMIDNGDRGKRIWITEFGAPTGGPGNSHAANQFDDFVYGSDFMKESAQRDLVIQAVEFYDKYKDWMGPFFWYSLKDSGQKRNTPENFFGLLRYDGSKKPAYDAFKNAIAADKNLQ